MKRLLGIFLIITLLLSSAFSESRTAETAANQDPQNSTVYSATVISSGTYLWYLSGTELACADPSVRQDAARIPLTALYAEDPGSSALQQAGIALDAAVSPAWTSLLSRDETGVSLCMALADPDGTVRTLMYDLALLEGSQIVISGVRDATDTLGGFFDPARGWLEIDMLRLEDGTLLTGALDPEYQYHLYSSRTAEEAPAEITSEPLMTYNATVPHGSGLLLVCYAMEDMNTLELSALDLATGERSEPEAFSTGADATGAFCFVWDEAENLLCFTVGNTAYRFTPGSGEAPVPFCVVDKPLMVNRHGTIFGGQYILYAEDGSLVWCDIHADLQAERIQILNASGDENIPDLSSEYNAAQTACFTSVAACEDVSLIPEYVLNQSTDYDIYVIDMNGSIYDALKTRGYFQDLAGSAVLRSAVADMSDAVRAAVYDGEKLAALPISAQNECLALNLPALQELTGLSREEIPTDWPGFLGLLNQLAEDGILTENSQYTVLDAGETGDELKEAFFSLIMSDCLLWKRQSGAAPDEIPAVLLPALRALDAVAWDSLGLEDEKETGHGWDLSDDRIPLLSVVQPEISVMAMENGVEYWPLSLAPGGERLIAQTVSVMLINPWSPRAESAAAFMEYAWEHLDILARMSLCQSMNDPVQNTAYDEDIAYLEQMRPIYEDAIAAAKTDAEAEALRRELNEMEAFLNDYRENAAWLASEQSIADYRALSGQFAPAVPEFWSADEEDAAILQYLDGLMPAEQFVTQFVSALKMALLEGE